MSHFHFYKSKYIEFVSITDSIINFKEHSHSSNYIFTFITSGEAELYHNSEKRIINTYDGFIIAPYENHSLISHDLRG